MRFTVGWSGETLLSRTITGALAQRANSRAIGIVAESLYCPLLKTTFRPTDYLWPFPGRGTRSLTVVLGWRSPYESVLNRPSIADLTRVVVSGFLLFAISISPGFRHCSVDVYRLRFAANFRLQIFIFCFSFLL